jgi:hypothetical protein
MKRFLPLVAVALAACHAGENRAVDESLLLGLEEARAWQHRADVHLADGDVAGALADVEHVLAVGFPAGAPEGEETRLDAFARLGQLHLARGEEVEALAAVERGRREATRDSFYRAHLETVAGEISEARGKRLADSDPVAAKAARREALDDYARSIEINKRVQATLIGKPR